MYRDFLEGFGFDLYGLGFERVLWLFTLALAGWGLYGGIALIRGGDRNAGVLRTLVSVAAMLYTGFLAYQSWFGNTYSLQFQKEVIIHTYALCIVTGFLLATWVAAREAQRVGISAIQILDLSFWALVFGMLGARVLFIVVNHEVYYYACTDPEMLATVADLDTPRPAGRDCLLVFKFWEGGLVFYGAFLGAVASILYYCRRHSLRPLVVLDTMVPSLALGQAFGRLGCLGGGCCWGGTCTTGFGISYRDGEMPFEDLEYRLSDSGREALLEQGHTESLHPTQLYESFGELGIFLALLLWRPHKRVHGEILALWMSLYGFFRTITEITRGDRVRGYVTEIEVEAINTAMGLPPGHATFLTTSQLIGLVLGVSGIVLFRVMRARANLVPLPKA